MNPASPSDIDTARKLDAGRQSRVAAWLLPVCRKAALRRSLARLACIREGGTMWSQTLRQILREDYGVEVGSYSYGACLMPGSLPRGTRVGRYCSFAGGLRVMRRNHPVDRISQHPLFYNAALGLLPQDSIPAVEDNPLCIGHDVWIGMNVLIAPGCRTIGNSAVVASGAVVSSDVPSFSIVGGVPAKVIRPRVSPELQTVLAETEWWSRSLTELATFLPWMMESLTPELAAEFRELYTSTFELWSMSTSPENHSAVPPAETLVPATAPSKAGAFGEAARSPGRRL